MFYKLAQGGVRFSNGFKVRMFAYICGPPGEFNPSWEWVRPDRTYPRRGRLSQTVATSTTYTNTVTRGSTARATHRAVPLPKQEESTEGVCILRMGPKGNQGEASRGGQDTYWKEI